MPYESILWDLDDDASGNVRHCLEHGVSKDEVEYVLEHFIDADLSRSTGLPVVFGDTPEGRHLMVVFEVIDETAIYPITAYEVPRKRQS